MEAVRAAAEREDVRTIPGQIFTEIRRMLDIRKGNSVFSSALKSVPVEMGNPAVFGFHKGDKLMVLANFSEREQWADTKYFDWFGLPGEMEDLLSGRRVKTWNNQILLGPYEVLWLA